MKRSSEDALDASADHLTCAERWKKIMGRRERDEGRLDSGVTDEDLFEIQFSRNSSDGDSEGDHDDSDTNEESAERLHEPRGETKVMNTATWAQLVSGVGDDASSTVTRETTTVSDGKRPSVDSSASYIATSENESTTTDPEGIHASLKMLDTVAIVRLEPGVKTTPAEEAVVTLDEGYISVAHVLTTEKKNEILDDTGRDYAKPPRDYRGFVMSFGGSAKAEQYGGYSGCSWILWSLPEWKIVIAANACLPSTTVNLAAYTGMNNGVKAALAHGAEDLVVVGDPRLPTPQSLGAGQKGSLVILLNTHKQLMAKLRSVKCLHVVKEYNAAADSLATEALEFKISRVMLAEARKSELATLNRIQEVIYEPREDEGTTKVEPRDLEHWERDLTGSDDCQLEVAGKCIQDDISGGCGGFGNIADVPRSQSRTRKADNTVDEPSIDCPGASLGPVDDVGAPPRPRFHAGRRVWPYMERGKPDLAKRQNSS
ncbi:hypothetical protein F443_16469 [Phytophthora nicotianae P1569]|uniref:RNase H type-1 domain-containing protein n=1 Tax=Phytophthora nicotianae P1569 TaxID=1317065 RepID=V9EHI3_PHYNI|nr:hypothetical protein F443_16469 [Phytophthora nicotianae P1569]